MFEAFQRHFAPDPDRASETDATAAPSVPGLVELIARLGGTSFNQGLYRVVRASDLDRWQQRVSIAFPHIGPRVTCFGYDWLGRVFAVDGQRIEQGQAGVVLFEPGTGQVLEVPANLETFHDHELVAYGEEALAIGYHEDWLARGGLAPGFAQCVGYKVPLFLGGIDDVPNLELSDLEVYWYLMVQLIVKTRDLPPGTKIKDVIIK